MSAIAILRPVVVRLAEGDRKPRRYYSITWRGPLGESSAGLHYLISAARDMARQCGAAEIVEEDVEAVEASPAPRLADMTYEDIQALHEETP